MTALSRILPLIILSSAPRVMAKAAVRGLSGSGLAGARQLLGVNEPIDLGYAKENPPFPDYARNRDCSAYPDVMTVSFGWYQSWATYREPDSYPVPPSALDASAYTHLAYSFAGINENFELEPYNGDFQGEEPLYSEFVGLKRKNPQLKTLIAVGGWTFSDPSGPFRTRFSDMVLTAERRAIFVESTLRFMRKYGFDGIDLDWEFPATRAGSRPEDKQTYAQLVLDLRKAFDDAPEYYEITMSVPLHRSLIDPGYDLITLSQGLDFMNLMAYNLYGNWNDAVYAHTYSPDIFTFLEYFVQSGVPTDKMVLGFAAYGRSYIMQDPNCLTFGCPFIRSGPGVGEPGLVPYFSIQDYIANGEYISIDAYNPTSGTAIMVLADNILITYDSPQSFSVKAKYALDSCFRGLMWWAADYLRGGLDLQVPMNPAPPTPINPMPPATPTSNAVPTPSPTNAASTPAPTTKMPTAAPTPVPTTKMPTSVPTVAQTTASPSPAPTFKSTSSPTAIVTESLPTEEKVPEQTFPPTIAPIVPTVAPVEGPKPPTIAPTLALTERPTMTPTFAPSQEPTVTPTAIPTMSPIPLQTNEPTLSPTQTLTEFPSMVPSSSPTLLSDSSQVEQAIGTESAGCRETVTIAVAFLSSFVIFIAT